MSDAPVGAARSGSEHPLLAWARAEGLLRGRDLAQQAFERGLAVTDADGSPQPIPIGAVPVIVDDSVIEHRRQLGQWLLSATAKAARWRMRQQPDRVRAALSGVEQRLVDATWRDASALAVARIDFMIAERAAALEVNTTIPAMQGYSDIAAASWLATFAPERADLPALLAANGSNSDALLAALTGLYRLQRTDPLQTIGLLCRSGDAQLTELRHLQQRFTAAGFTARIVHPHQLRLVDGYLHAAGQRLQLVYRHLFVSRLAQIAAPDLEAALAAGSAAGTLILNPPTPHLEMKSTLAVLSRALEAPPLQAAIGLDDEELAAIAAAVPWTRELDATLADSAAILADVIADPDGFVLKRSWSYGGHAVFVGRARDTDEFRRRVHAVYADVNDWGALCAAAANDTRGGGFIVQRAVPRQRSTQLLCTPSAVRQAEVTTDYAAYASLGIAPDWSGVCRAAVSDVVNIVGGGGVVPIIRRAVAERLVAQLGSGGRSG